MAARQVRFPNALGHTKPAAADVAALQARLGFSSDLADYLITQNGFAFREMKGADVSAVLGESLDEDARGPDLSELFDLDRIARENTEPHPFAGLAVILGTGYGGDDYAEVLIGTLRGHIVSLNHEGCGGSSTLRELGEMMDDFEDCTEGEDFYELDPAAQADILFGSEDLDLAWVVAPSLSALLERGVYLTERCTGKVVPHT